MANPARDQLMTKDQKANPLEDLLWIGLTHANPNEQQQKMFQVDGH